MAAIREVGPGEWAIMRDVRLAALAEAPHAFESTYEREAGFTQERWRTRINDRSVNYLAYDEADPGEPVGLAGVFVHDGAAELVSMWVRPSARGRKVGETLITACADWARSRGHDELFLWVFEPNTPARRLYERRGFLPTGERQPLPANPAAIEIKMRLVLACAPDRRSRDHIGRAS